MRARGRRSVSETDALRMRAFPVEDRSYSPHLTLARRSTTVIERRLPQPIAWRVNAFALVASETVDTGPLYRTIAEWPLVVVEAAYVLSTPGWTGPSVAGPPSVTESVAGTLPPTASGCGATPQSGDSSRPG